MARKPRSQRRKKGRSMGVDDNGGDGMMGTSSAISSAGGSDSDGDNNNPNVDFLSDEHTIADSISAAFSFDTGGAGSGMGLGTDDYEADDGIDADEYLMGNYSRRPGDAANAASESRLLKLQDSLALLEDIASEKRSSRREGMFRRVFRALTQYATGPSGIEAVCDETERIVAACNNGLRAGQPSEQYASCRVLEATAVAIGADQDDYVDLVEKSLRRVIMTTTRAVPVRVAALRALSMAVFVCSSDTETPEAIMDLCESIVSFEKKFRNESVSMSLRATALDCWGLQASTVEDLYLAGQDDVQIGRGLAILPMLQQCLETNSIDLRSAAGECVALIHEARLNLGVTAHCPAEDGDDDGADDAGENGGRSAGGTLNVTARQFQRGSWEGSDYEVIMDEIQQLIAEYAVESRRYMSKKDKKEQRATFREFMSTIVDDESPQEVVAFRNGNLTLNSWREIVQLNFVRHCVQGGFQIQLMTNPTLQAIFGADADALNDYAASTMSQLEKRLIMSKTSKASKNADVKLTKQRDKRENVKNYFITIDD